MNFVLRTHRKERKGGKADRVTKKSCVTPAEELRSTVLLCTVWPTKHLRIYAMRYPINRAHRALHTDPCRKPVNFDYQVTKKSHYFL